MGKKFVIVITILLLLATPALNDYANLSRNVAGYGGECLLFLFPSLIYACYLSIRDLTKTMKEEIKNG
ncbi:hypothetical protein [Holdemania sp. 1001095H_141210_F2]|uniref:hypothetical protein n=1 Tax=Holdemania sp. 1001095H_141210_F2 TaxID=2787149 RepID=UPI00189E5AB3|nr:hypothetical protein [Holdemania sp. 1001095H_141210_F2]